MNFRYEVDQEDFRPRLIIWEIEQRQDGRAAEQLLRRTSEQLTAQECMTVLESIARMAKPIIVLTGAHLLQQEDMFNIVEYGHALGLKMIIETPPEDITQDTLRQYSIFGPRVFRILLDGCIKEDIETRFRRTAEFYTLERCLRLLKSAGYEIHLGVTVKTPHIRELAFEHDYAFRRAARGLYCHLNLDRSKQLKGKQNEYTEEQIEEFIEAIAKMKRYSPDNMYFSPQCVQYGFVGFTEPAYETDSHLDTEKGFQWKHMCLGGKRFAYITHNGKVYVCSGLNQECGDLRITDFDFQEIWEASEIFRDLRDSCKSCKDTREYINLERIGTDDDGPIVEYML